MDLLPDDPLEAFQKWNPAFPHFCSAIIYKLPEKFSALVDTLQKHISTELLRDPFPHCHKNDQTYPLCYESLHHRTHQSAPRLQSLRDSSMHLNG